MRERSRVPALIALAAGGVGSVALTLYAGRGSRAPLSVLLIAAWVLTPFLLLGLASARARHWSSLTRAALHGVTLVLAVCSLAIYATAALHPPAKPVARFVAVPPLSWLLIAVVLGSATLVSRRRARGSRHG